MFQKFEQHINTTFPFIRGKKLLLACSGGVDSVVLTHLCIKSGLDITLAHCNFRLRAEESDVDAVFVSNLATQFDVDLVDTVFDTKTEAEKREGSIQMVARDLRYAWFEKILEKQNLDYILTAHHADDALETFIINLSRGTGLDGLTGIPQTNGNILRPLLPFSRDEILTYASKESLHWREDSSNSDTKYLRNKIRKNVVPRLKALHPKFLDIFLKTQHLLNQSKEVQEAVFESTRKRLFQKEDDTLKISVAEIKQLKPLDAYLHGLFKSYGFTAWEDLQELLDAMSGKEIHSPSHRLLKDREFLYLQKKQQDSNAFFSLDMDVGHISTPINLSWEAVYEWEKSPKNVVFIDRDKLNAPLTLRKWRKGDYFYPLGMEGRKKLSKLFKDEKMDVFTKESQWLLCSAHEIVWVIGKRADERFKVDEHTTRILKMTYSI